MEMSREEYGRLTDSLAPKSKTLRNCVWAFLVGGLICVLGQLILNFWSDVAGLDETLAATATSVTLIFLSALFTGLCLYDKLAKHAGAGTLVPITGFANAVVAPAMEYRTEGLITGTAVKLFTIAGPVIVCGVAASVLYGVLLAIFGESEEKAPPPGELARSA
ncbi:MAG: stage V sporulation protein AC [Oscillospiraceae bacterium]|nr:stage V sporulation protein AC [Oscillospiraceae bacterium]